MNKELAASMKKLNKENRRIIMKMENYMETRSINEICCEDILTDIVGMALEYQERGELFSKAIGTDYEEFCKELVKNSPRQSVAEKVLGLLRWLVLFSMCLMPVLYFIEIVFPKLSPSDYSGIDFYAKISFVTKYYILMFVLVIGWFFVKKYTYKPMKYVLGTYIGVIMAFFLFSDAIINYFVKNAELKINIIIWCVVFGLLLLILDMLKRLIAFTAAYKKRKKFFEE